MAMLFDSVAPLVKKISRGSAPTRLATCYRGERERGRGRRRKGERGGREGREEFVG